MSVPASLVQMVERVSMKLDTTRANVPQDILEQLAHRVCPFPLAVILSLSGVMFLREKLILT